MTVGKITRWNMYDYAPAQRMEYQRARRAEAREMMDKSTALANTFASIQTSHAAETGNIISRMAMQRMNKTA